MQLKATGDPQQPQLLTSRNSAVCICPKLQLLAQICRHPNDCCPAAAGAASQHLLWRKATACTRGRGLQLWLQLHRRAIRCWRLAQALLCITAPQCLAPLGCCRLLLLLPAAAAAAAAVAMHLELPGSGRQAAPQLTLVACSLSHNAWHHRAEGQLLVDADELVVSHIEVLVPAQDDRATIHHTPTHERAQVHATM
jgi:hypothetical protein